MSHTVVRLTNAEVTDELTADELSSKIESELENRGYETNDVAIGDNTDMDSNVYVRAVIDFKLSSEADSFAGFLRKFVDANLARKQNDGEGFVEGVVDQHECQHMKGKNQPCKPVEWKIE